MTSQSLPDRASQATPAPKAARRLRVPLAWPFTLAVGAAVVAMSAQVAVRLPFSPVPGTLQGLAVFLVGGLFGAAIGTGALVLYLLAGAFGLPVFAPIGPQGLARLSGPTGGYLLAFPVAAAMVGRLGEQGRFLRCLYATLVGMVIIHFGGWAQLAVLTGNPSKAFALGVTPFLLQDSLKATLAAAVLWRAHHTLRLRS